MSFLQLGPTYNSAADGCSLATDSRSAEISLSIGDEHKELSYYLVCEFVGEPLEVLHDIVFALDHFLPARDFVSSVQPCSGDKTLLGRFAEPDAAVGFGYVMNRWSFRVGEPGALRLAAAV